MADQASEVAKFIFSRLSSDVTIQGLVGKHPISKIWQVYEEIQPDAGAVPCIVFTMVPGSPYRHGAQGKVTHRLGQYIVKAIDKSNSYGVVAAISERIFELFNGANSIDLDEVVICGCTVDGDIQYVEIEDGIRYNHKGYMVHVRSYAK